MNFPSMLRTGQQAVGRSAAVFFRDVGHGLLEVGHNSLALLGLLVVAAVVFAADRADMRELAEAKAYEWLHTRQEARSTVSADAQQDADAAEVVATATAATAPPKELTRQQAAVAKWIARRYKVAPEPIGSLVQEAWAIGQRAGLDPTLILAIMAVESSFNPFAQSPVGAQGLMQVLTRVHPDKYEAFGGSHAAFDPISNLRVGVLVLKECIARAGSVQDGLRHYVGAALVEGDGGYVGRVLAEQGYIRKVADGKGVPFNASNTPPAAREPIATPTAPADQQPAAQEQIALLR